MNKYKACCGKRCMVFGCETKEHGGCYCLCRLKDSENQCIMLLEGKSFRHSGGIIYQPSRIPIPLEGNEKEEEEKTLTMIRNRIKEYEI